MLSEDGRSAFGVEHGVSKGLRPANMRALDKVGRTLTETRAGDYANAKLGLRLTGDKRAKKQMRQALRPIGKQPLP